MKTQTIWECRMHKNMFRLIQYKIQLNIKFGTDNEACCKILVNFTLHVD